MTKMFTGVAVLQLVQAGKLRLDAPLGTYLTDYPNRDIANEVTLHHLLTHTGGTGDVFAAELAARRGSMPSLQDYVALHGARAPRFEPGSRHEYSNYGFVLLGRVIERASGQSYYDYVAKHVFAPAGMTHSDFATIDEAGEERAIGYTRYLRRGRRRRHRALARRWSPTRPCCGSGVHPLVARGRRWAICSPSPMRWRATACSTSSIRGS